ncbi:sigma-70 family RNA polymerase sigma factor [Singulisphaera sp. Ch08]|uniref:Sigma-70 family RNA polymerase sigma factor n=1 Tax=Singulisphaera sp. Ch08 TaxID=3120278 RepID=A0AAU7CQQ4_9BACT
MTHLSSQVLPQEREGVVLAPELDFVISTCLSRIRRWRVPPSWMAKEWAEEIKSEATVAGLQAFQEFDDTRGVPREAFLHQRVMQRTLALYRREWTYAVRRVVEEELDRRAEIGKKDLAKYVANLRILQQSLNLLPESDLSIIEEIFWGERSQTEIAEELGISQQAVSKRKHRILETLRGSIISFELYEEYGL